MTRHGWFRLILVLMAGALIAAFFVVDGPRLLTLDGLKAQQAAWSAYQQVHP